MVVVVVMPGAGAGAMLGEVESDRVEVMKDWEVLVKAMVAC